jgi:hypothetical protein
MFWKRHIPIFLLIAAIIASMAGWAFARSPLTRRFRRAWGSTGSARSTGSAGSTGSTANPSGSGSSLHLKPESIKILNEGFHPIWKRLRPEAVKGLRGALLNLAGQKKGSVEFRRVSIKKIDLDAPPGFRAAAAAGRQRLELRVPLASKGWRVDFHARVKYRYRKKVLGIKISVTKEFTLKVKVRSMQVRQGLWIDIQDPQRPRLQDVDRPSVRYDLDIHSTNLLVEVILWFAKSRIRKELDGELKKIIKVIASRRNDLIAFSRSNENLGRGAPPAASTQATDSDMLQAAEGLSSEIQRHHLPWDTIVETRFRNGSGNPTVAGYEGMGDSAIWTGHYLAAEAYRYAVSGNPRAIQNAMRALRGIERLLDAGGRGGLLTRFALPESEPFARTVARQSKAFRTTVGGVPYVALGDISRDQYIGVMLGISLAYDLIPDPTVQTRCARLATRILEYLERNEWIATKQDGKTISAPFNQTAHHRLTFLQVGRRIDPRRYGPAFQRYAPVSSAIWLSAWASTMDPHRSYYKFNLFHVACLNLMRLETDPKLFREYSKAFRLMRRAIGHHQNAHFNLVEAAVWPSRRAALTAETRNLLGNWLLRPRRDLRVTNSTDPSIAQTDILTLPGFMAGGGSGQREWVARYPLPVERRPTTGFLWQRSPFKLDGSGDGKTQFPGVDFILPYWMGRYYGVLP